MSGRRHKKLNLLIKFSDSIFIKFDVKAYLRWTCIQNKLAYKVPFYFKLFSCLADVKRPKFCSALSHWNPTRAPPWAGCWADSTSRPVGSFYTIRKLNLCLKTDISKTAWINAWWGVEFEQINAGWAWLIIVSDNKFAFSTCEKYIVLWAAEIYWATNFCSYLPNKG